MIFEILFYIILMIVISAFFGVITGITFFKTNSAEKLNELQEAKQEFKNELKETYIIKLFIKILERYI